MCRFIVKLFPLTTPHNKGHVEISKVEKLAIVKKFEGKFLTWLHTIKLN